jgi:hypothetical protein
MKKLVSQLVFHAKHGNSCKASSVINTMASKGSTISSSSLCSPETVDFLLPTAPCPKSSFWFEMDFKTQISKSDVFISIDSLAAACRPPYRTPTRSMNVSLSAITPGCKMDPRSMQPLVLDFAISLQQLLLLRSLLFGLEGDSLSKLIRTAYSSSSDISTTALSSNITLGELEKEDLACGVWCLDPVLRDIAPPLDGIAIGNTFSLNNLPWFQATHFPVFLPPNVSAASATVLMQGVIESRKRLGVVLGQSFFVLTEVLVASSSTSTSNTTIQPKTSLSTSASNGNIEHPALGNNGNNGSVNGASQSPMKVKGKALLVIPLHLISLHLISVPESSPAILDVRFISGLDLNGLAVEATDSPVHTDSFWAAASTTTSTSHIPRPRRYGFALALESPEVAARAIEHVTVASSRAVTAKVAAFEKLWQSTVYKNEGKNSDNTTLPIPQRRQVELVNG